MCTVRINKTTQPIISWLLVSVFLPYFLKDLKRTNQQTNASSLVPRRTGKNKKRKSTIQRRNSILIPFLLFLPQIPFILRTKKRRENKKANNNEPTIGARRWLCWRISSLLWSYRNATARRLLLSFKWVHGSWMVLYCRLIPPFCYGVVVVFVVEWSVSSEY